ncbi:uncharacterized protein LOC100377816 [Saccoglossus kowalevskii]|uniref:Uncharacterized protein LOC100377816 n=1 Tax=Saccoglossus kowalevskii TaxID=10224 RepID=A0ABM0GL95_SACKO|nr:PREDICTED: uncharacterized protein LOC100377816 [Saccoglossus kowalevskii]
MGDNHNNDHKKGANAPKKKVQQENQPPLPNQLTDAPQPTPGTAVPATSSSPSVPASTSKTSVASKWKGAAGTATRRPSVMVSSSPRPGTATGDGPKRLSVDSRKLSIDGGNHHYTRRPSRVSVVSVDYPNKLQLAQINAAAAQNNAGQQPFQPAVVKHSEKGIRAAIPIMPMWMAIVCCVLNCVIPGSGTVVSGVTLFCCSSPQDNSKKDELTDQLCTNIWVGISQLMTITFLLVGWFWSIAWGILMIQIAQAHKRVKKQEKEIQTALTVANAFMSNAHNAF